MVVKKIQKVLNIISIVLLVFALITKITELTIFGIDASRLLFIGTLIFSGVNLILNGSIKAVMSLMDLKDKRKFIWVNGISFISGVILLIAAGFAIWNFKEFDTNNISIIIIGSSLLLTSVETFL